MDRSRWISLDEAAEYLGVTQSNLYKLLQRKQLPGHKLGRLWKFKIEELDEWIKTGKSRIDQKEDDIEEGRN